MLWCRAIQNKLKQRMSGNKDAILHFMEYGNSDKIIIFTEE
jgi:hypothetical protein